MIEQKKLKNLAKEIYDIANKHGWHEKYAPDGQWMSLVMSEIGEAIEADRRGSKAVLEEGNEGQNYTDDRFIIFYEGLIKGSLEEEFADMMIRLLDFAYMKWGDGIDYSYEKRYAHLNEWSFAEYAWYLCKYVLDSGYIDIANSIGYVMDWADDLGINLERHIKLKMRYNNLRSYKHGGKKY